MNNEIIFKSILTNIFSYIPLWKNSVGDNIVFKKYTETDWGLYNKNTAQIHKLKKINCLDIKQKILFFSAEIFIIMLVLFGFIWNALQIFIPSQFIIFMCITVIAYVLFYKFHKYHFFGIIMLFAFVFSSGYVLYNFGSKALFLTITFYAGLEIAFAYTIPTLIEKKNIFKNNNTYIFTPIERKGILLMCYTFDAYSEKDIKKIHLKYENEEKNIFTTHNMLLQQKNDIETKIMFEKNSSKPNQKQLAALKKSLTDVEVKIKNIEKQILILNQNKEINNEF